MISFKQFNSLLDEEKLNYNHTNQHWQVRSDDESHTFRHERERVILKNPKPHIDHDAHEAGKRVYAYMQGDIMRDEPDLSKHKSHPVKFVPGDTDHPFVHAHTGKPFKAPDYMVFHKNAVTAFHKK